MQRDHQDLWWGGLLALGGLSVAGYSAAHYTFGTLRRMGPGFFPVVLGLVLVGLGLAIAIPAWRRAGSAKPFAWRETLAVAVALLLFGMLLERMGLLATTAITSLIASSVAPAKGILWRLILALIITAVTWAVFIGALQMPLPVWPWSR
jgi:hypothetical protein